MDLQLKYETPEGFGEITVTGTTYETLRDQALEMVPEGGVPVSIMVDRSA